MRIGIDVTPLLLRSAGVKTWTWHFLNHLRKRAKDDRIIPLPEVSSAGTLAHDRSVLGSLATWSRLAMLYATNAPGSPLIDFRTRGMDVFHASNQTRRLPKRTPVTATIHDMTCWIMPELHTPANVRADRQFAAQLLKKNSRFIAVSANTRTDAVRLLGIAPDRIQVVHPGISEAFFAARAKPPVTGAKPYVLFVGTLEPRKNLMTLLDAWQSVRTSIRAEFDLLIAGDTGWHCEPVLARLREKREGVHYLGYRPQEELPGLMAGATTFVYPSLYEGFGFPVAEAMASGVPVITSNCSSLPEIAQGAGELIDPLSPQEIRTALERLLTSPTLREGYRREGLARARTFSWDESACRTLDFFHRAG